MAVHQARWLSPRDALVEYNQRYGNREAYMRAKGNRTSRRVKVDEVQHAGYVAQPKRGDGQVSREIRAIRRALALRRLAKAGYEDLTFGQSDGTARLDDGIDVRNNWGDSLVIRGM